MNEHGNRTKCRLIFQNGRPAFVKNGSPISYAAYSDPVTTSLLYTPEQWKERICEFVESGVHTYTIQPESTVGGRFGESPFWTADGVYPEIDPEKYFCVDRQAQAILESDPDANIIVRFSDCVPKAWFDANPAHTQRNSKDSLGSQQPSLASAKALTVVCRLLERVVNYCESRPWSDRIIGYLYYPLGEGITNLNVEGSFFDCCEVMQEAFRSWVRRNYSSESDLKKAWDNPDITFDTVRVPTDQEWKQQRETVLHWPDKGQLQNMRDYLLLQRELFLHWYRSVIRKMRDLLSHRPVIFGIDMAKQAMMGWQIRLAFDGAGPGADFPNIIAASGCIDLGQLLDEPGLDLLVTPADYTARTVGYGWESEGIADSMRLRGKIIFVENDCRTFAPGEENTLGAFHNVAEMKAGMLRNTAWSLSRGHIDYWMIAGGAYFHHKDVQEYGIRPLVPVLDQAPYLPHRETEHAVAMILDDSSPLYEDGTSGYQNLAVLWQRTMGLSHCGIPYRVYLFSDLEKGNMPDYRCYLFPNLFQMDEKKMRVLRQKVFRDHRLAIFGPASGITDGTTVSSEWASRLLGVDMELVPRQSPRRVIVHGYDSITGNLPASMIYGDSLPYGPILVPKKDAVESAGGRVLGEATTFWGINRPGLFVKDNGDYKIAWSIAVPLPGCLIRELARWAGCHVWCEEDDVVLASDTVAAIHSVKRGNRILKFPDPRTVWDLVSGEKIGDHLTQIQLDIHPPETRLLYFGETLPCHDNC